MSTRLTVLEWSSLTNKGVGDTNVQICRFSSVSVWQNLLRTCKYHLASELGHISSYRSGGTWVIHCLRQSESAPLWWVKHHYRLLSESVPLCRGITKIPFKEQGCLSGWAVSAKELFSESLDQVQAKTSREEMIASEQLPLVRHLLYQTGREVIHPHPEVWQLCAERSNVIDECLPPNVVAMIQSAQASSTPA